MFDYYFFDYNLLNSFCCFIILIIVMMSLGRLRNVGPRCLRKKRFTLISTGVVIRLILKRQSSDIKGEKGVSLDTFLGPIFSESFQ